MFETNFDNRYIKIKVVGVNTAGDEKLSGGLNAVNFMLSKNFQGVNYYAVDRNDTNNLAQCKVVTDHKFRLLNTEDENKFVNELRKTNLNSHETDLIFVVADEVWENVKTVAIAAHCAKKIGVPVIFIAGGNFEDAEGEIIFDALVKLPSKNFAEDSAKILQNFIEAVALPGQPKIDVKFISHLVKDSAACVGYGERDGKNAVIKAAKAALEFVEGNEENFKTAEKILFNVTAAKGNISLEEAQKLSRLLKRHAPKAEVSFGFSIDNWLLNKVKFLILAA
ncbi:MAG: hypothetical protein IJ685_08660 [Selenomonadaceae bacterium]|nr:hypothetical protein [Selenomonadaceae bacterium]